MADVIKRQRWGQVKRSIEITGFLTFVLSSFILILKFIKIPFLFIFVETFFILIYIIIKCEISRRVKIFIFNLAIIILLLGFAEAFFSYDYFIFIRKPLCVTYSGTETVEDELRGYAGSANAKVRSKEVINGKVIYDIIYSRNKYGLRVTPHDIQPAHLNPDFKNVIFFGCSFTYGDGVNDNENLPFMFEDRSQGKYEAYNFGFHGYGPQQMLRILESGMVDKIVSNKQPFIAVYGAMVDHVSRCAFKYPASSWYKGPAYKLDRSGNIVLWDAKKQYCLGKRLLLKSYLFNRIYYRVRNNDIELFLKVISKSKKIFESKYHGQFYVLYWDAKNNIDRMVLEKLKKEDVNIFLTSQILGITDIREFYEKYAIIGDGHPNNLAYERIAEYLLKNINSKIQ